MFDKARNRMILALISGFVVCVVRKSSFGRFVLFEHSKIGRFVSVSEKIWICGLYKYNGKIKKCSPLLCSGDGNKRDKQRFQKKIKMNRTRIADFRSMLYLARNGNLQCKNLYCAFHLANCAILSHFAKQALAASKLCP